MTDRLKYGSTIDITLVGIAVPADRHRMLRLDNVNAIAESMREQGQLQAIVVRQRPGGGYWLIAGRHRYEAAKQLKWKTIRSTLLEGISDDQAELAEIDENLIRAELSPAETAMHFSRRKELYEKLHPTAMHGGAPPKKGKGGGAGKQRSQDESFVSDSAKRTGKSRSTIARNTTRGKKVKALADVVGTSLDTGAEIDALAKLPVEQQSALIQRAKAGEAVSACAAERPAKVSPAVKAAADAAELSAKQRLAISRLASENLQQDAAGCLPSHPSKFDPVQSCLMRVRALVLEWFPEIPQDRWPQLISELRSEVDRVEEIIEKRKTARLNS